MNIKRVKLFLGTLALGFVGTASAIADHHGDKEKTPMQKEFKIVSSKLKFLRKLDKEDKGYHAAAAKAVREAGAAMLRTMAYSPSMVKEMPDGDEKLIALADSRRLMGLTYAILCELEVAYLKKDDKLVRELTKKWKGLKKEGHKKYKADD